MIAPYAEARFERAIEHARLAALRGRIARPLVNVPVEATAQAYAEVASWALTRAAECGVTIEVAGFEGAIERTVEIVRERCNDGGAASREALAELQATLREDSLGYIRFAALALRLSVEAGDFV